MFPVAGYSLGRFRTRLYRPGITRPRRPAATNIFFRGGLSFYENAVKLR